MLMGGLSKEREVSLVTGEGCAAALRTGGYEVEEVDVDRQIGRRLQEIAPDVCFNALHGPFGEDGSIQGLLNYLNIPYTHSGVAASALAMDKSITKLIANQLDIRTPNGKLVDANSFWRSDLSAPYVIKPINDGSSIDTYVVRDTNSLPFRKDQWPFAGRALLETFIAGRELTVTVLDDRPLTVTEIVPAHAFYNFQAKYAPGGSRHILPAPVPTQVFEECQESALRMHRALGCRGISRSDFILDDRSGRPIFLELNTQPGMTPTSLSPEQAGHVGIQFPQLVDILVRLARTD